MATEDRHTYRVSKTWTFYGIYNLINNKNKQHLQYIQAYLQALKIVSEYDQEIPQSQTADKPMAPAYNMVLKHFCYL